MTNNRDTRSLLLWSLALLFTLGLASLLLGLAFAQPMDLGDPRTWFTSVPVWGGVVLTLTAFLRANVVKNLKGVGVLVLVFGVSIGGALVAASGLLAPYGIGLDSGLLGAVVFGIAAGGFAAGLWDAGTGVAAAVGKANAKALVESQSAVVPFVASPQSVTDYLLDLVRQRFGSAIPVFVWPIIEAIAREFAGKALNEQTRAAIQRRFLDLLAKAGAPGRDL